MNNFIRSFIVTIILFVSALLLGAGVQILLGSILDVIEVDRVIAARGFVTVVLLSLFVGWWKYIYCKMSKR